MPSFTAQALAARVSGRLHGCADLAITGVEAMDLAQPGQITFIGDERHAQRWTESRASAALVQKEFLPVVAASPLADRALIEVADADLAMAQVLEMFAPPTPRPATGAHPSAVVDPSAVIGKDAAIGPGCVVGARAKIGDGCILHANVNILDDAVIGPGCELWPGVVIRERCTLGARVILHPNVVIGADGFGYRPAPGGAGLVKIPQIGSVEVGDDVEIGAGSCIDRGKFSATVIGAGTKIDNLVQIGHNCRIGRCCIIVGQCGIAGSVTLGDGVILGGKTAVRDHLTIGSGAKLAACSAVMDNVPAGVTWGGYPARDIREALREHVAVRKLPDLIKSLKKR